PPVESPASKHRRPSTCNPCGSNASRAPTNLYAPREAQPGSSVSSATTTGASSSTDVAGLRATIPRTVTRPAATNSLACSRERASPRLTSSASNPALRGTLLAPVCARSGQEVVRLGKRVGQRGVHRLEPTDVLGNGQFTKLLEVVQRLLDRVHRSLPVFEVDLPRQHRRIRHNTVTGQLSHVPLLDHVARHDVSTLPDGQPH